MTPETLGITCDCDRIRKGASSSQRLRGFRPCRAGVGRGQQGSTDAEGGVPLAQPGEIVEFAEQDLYRPLKLMYSAHQVGIDETLAAARLMGTAPRRARAVGLVPYSLETGYGLSPQAEDRLDELLERARAVLAEWGVEGA